MSSSGIPSPTMYFYNFPARYQCIEVNTVLGTDQGPPTAVVVLPREYLRVMRTDDAGRYTAEVELRVHGGSMHGTAADRRELAGARQVTASHVQVVDGRVHIEFSWTDLRIRSVGSWYFRVWARETRDDGRSMEMARDSTPHFQTVEAGY